MLQPVSFHQLDTLTLLPSLSHWKLLATTNPNTTSWNCQSPSQVSSINTHHSCPTGLFSSQVFLSIAQHQPTLLVEGISDPGDATRVRRALCKDSYSHFTSHLQIRHQTIMLQVTTAKHFWKQNTCYTDITAGIHITSHLFLHILSNLIYPLSS